MKKVWRVRYYRRLYDGSERVMELYYPSKKRAERYASVLLQVALPGEEVDIDRVPAPEFPWIGYGTPVHYEGRKEG